MGFLFLEGGVSKKSGKVVKVLMGLFVKRLKKSLKLVEHFLEGGLFFGVRKTLLMLSSMGCAGE